jgi:hypothetical protein
MDCLYYLAICGQQLYRAFRSSADHIVVVTHRALLSADNRDPTIGAGDRCTIIPARGPLLSVIAGCYCQFIKAVNNILPHLSPPRDLLPPAILPGKRPTTSQGLPCCRNL